MVRQAIVKKLRRFADALEDAGISVAHLLLFGSHARDTARADSDIDVCVVSKEFGRDDVQEFVTINTLAHTIDPLIEAVNVSLRKWKTDRISPLLYYVRKEGIPIIRT